MLLILFTNLINFLYVDCLLLFLFTKNVNISINQVQIQVLQNHLHRIHHHHHHFRLVLHRSPYCHHHLIVPLQKRQWATFAKGYNGPSFAKNRYHTKLQAAYSNYIKSFPD